MKIEWEYNLVEKPFCEQLKTMGWEWIEGDADLPESTERTSSREVLLKGRLAAALRKVNLRNGQVNIEIMRAFVRLVSNPLNDLNGDGKLRRS